MTQFSNKGQSAFIGASYNSRKRSERIAVMKVTEKLDLQLKKCIPFIHASAIND
jgi:hypothetical protein